MSYKIRVKKGSLEIEVEGPRDFVEEKYEELSAIFEEETHYSLSTERGELTESVEQSVTLEDYIREKGNPKTNLNREMVFAQWLLDQGIEQITFQHLELCFTEIRREVPIKLARDLRMLQDRGYLLHREGSGNNAVYSISADGIEYVENLR